MNQLFPIIRRKRRPLLPVESLHDLPPVPVEAVLPVTAAAIDSETKKGVTPLLPKNMSGNKESSNTPNTNDEAS
jgi:hypothetical protein